MLDSHKPHVIDKFNGLWRRGEPESTPSDHFTDCDNIRFIGTSEFGTRYGIGISQTVAVPLSNVKRLYNYPTPTGNHIIALTYDETTNTGQVYHVVDAATVFGPLLSIVGMTDLAFIPYAGRAYLSPVATFIEGDLKKQKGMQGEFLYVYLGAGVAARKAAGAAPTGNMGIGNGAVGYTDAGQHIFAIVYETDSGYLTKPGANEIFTTAPNFSVSFNAVPTSGSATVTKRHLVATKVITNFNGNLEGYQFFFVPNATINDNIGTNLVNISFYDSELLEDASHLIDNFEEIPAGATLSFYHNRLMLGATYTDESIFLVSEPGEPEAINQISGLLVLPLNGDAVTNGQELRDIFYGFKRSSTVAFVDNGDEPATWPMTTIDNALGSALHGVATVLDSGSSSVDFLIIANYQGIVLFNGRFNSPELSWKVQDFWLEEDPIEFGKIQIVNDPVDQLIICVLPSGIILIGNYANGMNYKAIRWTPNSFARKVNTVAIVNINQIIIGMDLQ